MNFGQFYQDGGVFMHVITMLAIITTFGLLRRIDTIRRTFRDPNEQLMRLRRGGAAVPSLIAAIVLVGTLGTAFGFVQVHGALMTVPADQWHLAASLGSKIAFYTLVWGLVCATPLTLAHGLLRHFEQRLRCLIESHA